MVANVLGDPDEFLPLSSFWYQKEATHHPPPGIDAEPQLANPGALSLGHSFRESKTVQVGSASLPCLFLSLQLQLWGSSC